VAWDDVEVVAVNLIFDHTIEVDAEITGHVEQHWYWEYSWNTSEFENGWHLVQARAWDNESHSLLHSIELLVDNEVLGENHRPEVTIEHPENEATVSGIINITGHAWDPDEGDQVELVQIAIDNTVHWMNATDTSDNKTWWTWRFEWDTTTVENGWHYIVARSFDGELHSEMFDIHVNVQNEVNQAPECWFEYPENGDTVRGVIEIVIAARDDNEVIGVDVSIDKGEWDEAIFSHMIEEISIWVYEWDTTTVEDGWHLLLGRAFDGELHSELCEIHVIVDNVQENHKPWVTIEEPENGATISGVIAIRGHAGDPDEGDRVELVQIAIDNTEHWMNATDTSDNKTWWTWVYEWDTTEVENGRHFIVARSFDGELYSNLWDMHVIVKNEQENRRPVVEIVHPLGDETLSGIVLVHGEASDPDEGDSVVIVLARIDHGDWFHTIDTSHDDSWSTWAFQWNTVQFENGEHCIYAKAYDGDLWSEIDSVCVLVHNENHRPDVSITHPEWGETLEGLYLIHGTASDPDDGDRVEMVLVRINDGEFRHATDTSPDDSWATWAYEWNTEEVDDGEHEICAKSWDGQLFSEVVCVEVLVDNINDPPRVEIIHPEMGANVSGIIVIWGHSSDDRGVKGVMVRIDDGEWDEAVDVSRHPPWRTWAYEWVTTLYENGEHRVCAKAWDGELWSDLDCIEVIVWNNETEGAGPGESGLEASGVPPNPQLMLLLAGGLSVIVVAAVLRHLFGVRKR
ncbi:MAG: Ig-like domain-containing protein, partial [Thermoplasmata archaeon]